MYIYIVYKQQDFNSDLLHRNLHVLHWKANDYILLERPLPTSSLLPLHKDTKLHSSAVDRADMSSAAEPKRPRFSSADTHKCHIHIIHNIDIYIYKYLTYIYSYCISYSTSHNVIVVQGTKRACPLRAALANSGIYMTYMHQRMSNHHSNNDFLKSQRWCFAWPIFGPWNLNVLALQKNKSWGQNWSHFWSRSTA